jgi:hypothetical protein
VHEPASVVVVCIQLVASAPQLADLRLEVSHTAPTLPVASVTASGVRGRYPYGPETDTGFVK